jgi:hypothetical protein
LAQDTLGPPMLDSSRARIFELLSEQDLVLDVGGGAAPFERADWVIDLQPYAARSSYGAEPDPASERFSAETWVTRDICEREPWPFADHQFDFSICSHTLEDVRDPLFVCSELIRVSRAGYIETPSRLEEQAYGFQGPWAGWGHHRWLVDLDGSQLTFVFKHHVLHNRPSDHFQVGFRDALAAEDRVLCLFWRERFEYRERIFLDADSLDAYLGDFVSAHQPPRRRRLGSRRAHER